MQLVVRIRQQLNEFSGLKPGGLKLTKINVLNAGGAVRRTIDGKNLKQRKS